ncbi:UdgX family uracil-DNA binding protein [Acetobacter indonesiensis]|uniref:UdgX family uracil-DNA binding protein n=1 Tax=Acetobacter indonesiensis TaxID=104101 RepID=UPI0020A4CCB2|nr:UdgX family uracil-DNA binding protein [Acetobacter indonesiensis]
MTDILLAHQVDMATWRRELRHHVFAGTAPDRLVWSVLPESNLFQTHPIALGGRAETTAQEEPLRLSRRVVELLLFAFQASDPQRFSLLYRLIFRIVHEGLDIITQPDDADLVQVEALADAVKAETLRFRTEFAAFFRNGGNGVWVDHPAHYVVEANATYCRARVAEAWSVETPYRRMQWNERHILFGPGTRTATEHQPSLWQPDGQGVWSGYPNSVIPPSHQDVAEAPTLDVLGAEAMNCHACALWQPANRTVFGEGPISARIMLVGEQPGDKEDLDGHPFVGPAGQVLDRALQEAGIERPDVYVTNAVKHFRFVWRGTRRLHQKPEQENIDSCRMWLDAERRLIKPVLIVMMGVTAAQSLLRRPVTISRERSRLIPLDRGSQGLVTVHPSYLLRLPNEEDKAREYQRFVADLQLAKRFMDESALPAEL